ncbi:MAG: cadherin-like domain-containing protein, partial [Granulosicoccus sp.]
MLAVAEVLESRVLYSADALGPLAPLLPDSESVDPIELLSAEFLSASLDAAATLDKIDWEASEENREQVESINTPGAEDDSLVDRQVTGADRLETDSRQIAFVDLSIPDAEVILRSLEHSGIEIVTIDPNQDGLLLISKTLVDRQDIDVVHVVSHGQPGALYLGNATLDASTIAGNPVALTQWGDALSAGADILFYGCDFAANEDGQQLLERIAELTGADVAASDDPTGQQLSGGDWELEASVGKVLSSTFDDAELRSSWNHSLATITVTVLTDAIPDPSLTVVDIMARGPGADVTLREAVIAASNTPGNDIIVLGDGTYQLTVPGAGEENAKTGDLDITAPGTITIQGNGAANTIIEQTAADRVFDLNIGVLHLENLAVTSGERSTEGAGVKVNAGTQLVARDVLFEDNEATGSGVGGAIYNQGSTVLHDTEFVNNTASDGGAIYNEGALEFNGGSVKQGSVTGEGGAIYNQGSTVLHDTEFVNNAASDGGAIYNGSLLEFNGGSVNQGSASSQGAGIYNSGTGSASINNVQLTGNIANTDGGGIYASGVLALNSVTLDDNKSLTARGGGIYHEGGVLTVTDVMFNGNFADDDGGGIHVKGDNVTFNRVTFSGNRADGDGGGVNMVGENSTFTNTTFSGNSAKHGGGIYANKDLTVTSSTFYHNTDQSRAGAIVIEGGKTVTLSNSVFDDNTTNFGFTNRDIIGKVDSGGFNLFTNTSQLVWVNESKTDLILPDMMLANLAPGTGYVTTHAPMPGSPVINAGGSVSHATDAGNATYDQMPDVGAHEASSIGSVMFWSDTAGNIWRSNTDFTNEQIIVSGRSPGFNSTTDIEVDMQSGRIFWLENNGSGWEVWRASIDGSGTPVKLVYGLVQASGIAVSADTGRVYILQGGSTGSIWSFNLSDGAGSNQDTDQIINGQDVEVDEVNQRLIWTEDKGAGSSGRIRAMNLVSGDIQTIYDSSSLDTPEGLALDTAARRIYFVDTATTTGYLIDYNGTVIKSQSGITGERIIYDFVEDRVTVASLQNSSFTAYDESLGSVASGVLPNAPEALAIGVTFGVDNLPTVSLSGPVAVDSGATVQLDNTVLEATDDYSNDAQLSWEIVTLPLHGMITVDGADLAEKPESDQRFTQEMIEQGTRVAYIHSGLDNSGADQFVVRVSDGQGVTSDIAVNVQVTVDSTLTVTVVAPLALIENETVRIENTHLSSTHSSEFSWQLKYTVTALPVGSQVQLLNNGVWQSATEFTQQDVDNLLVRYVQGGGEPDPGNDQITLTVEDSQGEVVNGILPLNITNENDYPTLFSSELTVSENGNVLIESNVLHGLDADINDDASQLRFAVTGLPVGAEVQLSNNGVWQAATSFTQADIDNSLVRYVHGSGEPDHGNDKLALTLSDGRGGMVSGVLSLNVENVNDSPVLATAALLVEESGSSSLSIVQLQASDEETPDTNLVYELSANTLTEGELRDSAGNARTSFTQQEVVDGRISYHHFGQEPASEVMEFELLDGDGARVSGQMSVQISQANDAPGVSFNALSINEGDAAVLDTHQINVTDSDHPIDNLTIEVTGAQHGELTLAGGANAVASGAQFLAGELVYTHNGLSTGNDTLTIRVTDPDGAVTTATMPITVQTVNDSPVLATAALLVEESGS